MVLRMQEAEIKDHKKKQILIIDADPDDRLFLLRALEESYEVYSAKDREELQTLMKQEGMSLSALICAMKDLSLRKEEREDGALIVSSTDRADEAITLCAGADDFLLKPFLSKEAVLKRVERAIARREDRRILLEMKKDPLTGLPDPSFFFSCIQKIGQLYPGRKMDALVFDIDRLHLINERFGRAYGDQVIKETAERLKMIFAGSGAMMARRGGHFLVLSFPYESYEEILEELNGGLFFKRGRVRVCLGICDDDIDFGTKFDRAMRAVKIARDLPDRNCAYYDRKMLEKELHAQRLCDDFDRALETGEFEVWYQPKFNVTGPEPFLTSAEALLRWRHPEFGLISPQIFIPLFEKNGSIRKLDLYVWRKVLKQLKIWRDELKITVPVSVNVTKADLYDPLLIDELTRMMQEGGAWQCELLLEITESAYGEDPDYVIDQVHALRRLGFMIEMDDFGTEQSSLNMISRLPIDALKIDMRFVKEAFSGKRDTRMIEIIIEIARYLNVLTVAEGVEDEEQYLVLKKLGCDVIQGYYFSKPVCAKEFEKFLNEKLNVLSLHSKAAAGSEASF
jgi:EAL domain-containing protein (putative c-di-GMP-specific phosphodiesterase class I)/GGDEF domain-containing protein